MLFIIQEDQVLLIRKKRGLGSGKINAAGGRLELGETEKECVARDDSNLHIHVTDPKYAGEADFSLVDGYCFHLIVLLVLSL